MAMWICQRLLASGFSRFVIIRDVRPKVIIKHDGNPHLAFYNVPCKLWECSRERRFGLDCTKLYKHIKDTSEDDKDNHQATHTWLAYLKWGVVALLITGFLGATVVSWQLHFVHQELSHLSSAFIQGEHDHKTHHHRHVGHLQHEKPNDDDVWFPKLKAKSQDPFTLLELCQTDKLAIRNLAIRALADKTNWETYQYRYVAQAADYRTLIGLARSLGADKRFFLSQPRLQPSNVPVLDELATMVMTLDKEVSHASGGSSNCPVAMAAQQHLQHQHIPTDDKKQYWGFDGSPLDVASLHGPPPEDQLLLQFLESVAQFCCKAEMAAKFVEGHGLAILQRIAEQHVNTTMLSAVASVLGNIALHPCHHEIIVKTGWLGRLKAWSAGKHSLLAVSAGRVLLNMDRDWTRVVLQDGVFLLYPLWRSTKTLHADVIFFHGLRGGAVKTWRQKDYVSPQEKDPEGRPHSDCWPKDWLAEDCPHIRILSVNYSTYISLWASKHNNDEEKRTLEGRSQTMLEKLSKAGVGSRPIIWVGHSMGGLLIKQILELCTSNEHEAVRKLTSGFLFFSVPHSGSSIATLATQIPQYLVSPSTELLELQSGAPHLTRLHDHFKEFVELNGIPCLSFGETLKTQFRKTLPPIFMVPPESSDPGVGECCILPLNHVNICKPASHSSLLYQRSLAFIHRCIFFSYMHRIRQAVSDAVD